MMRARPVIYGLMVFAAGMAVGVWLSHPARHTVASPDALPPTVESIGIPLRTRAPAAEPAERSATADETPPPSAAAPSDPKTALARASEIAGGRRLEAAEEIGETWGLTDPETAHRYADELADPALRSAFRRGVLRSWASRDPATVIGILRQTHDSLGPESVAAVVDGLVAGDPATALTVLLVGDPVPFQTVRAFMDRWAMRDPNAAARAIEGFGPEDGTGGVAREAFSDILGQRWAQQDPDAAVAWATRANHPPAAWSGVLTGLAATNPELALSVASGIPNQRPGAPYVSIVIATVAESDPAAAATYWQRAGIGEIGVYVANRIVRSWVGRDRAAAEQWTLALPAGEGRDVALATLAGSVETDAVHVAELVNAMTTERWQMTTARDWLRRAIERSDPAVAEFQNRLQLSASSRAQLAAEVRR